MEKRYAPLSMLFRLAKKSFIISGLVLTLGSIATGAIMIALAMAGTIHYNPYEDDSIFDNVIFLLLVLLPLGILFLIIATVQAIKKYKLLKDGRYVYLYPIQKG